MDSDKAGQDTAPITGPTSTAPLDSLFQAGLFPALVSDSFPLSDLSAPAGSSTAKEEDGEEEGEGERGSTIAAEDVTFDGEDGTTAGISNSPRTI